MVSFSWSETRAVRGLIHLCFKGSSDICSISKKKAKVDREYNYFFCLLFLLTSSSLRLTRFAIAAGNTVTSLSGMLSRLRNWQLNSCWRRREEEEQIKNISNITLKMFNLNVERKDWWLKCSNVITASIISHPIKNSQVYQQRKLYLALWTSFSGTFKNVVL